MEWNANRRELPLLLYIHCIHCSRCRALQQRDRAKRRQPELNIDYSTTDCFDFDWMFCDRSGTITRTSDNGRRRPNIFSVHLSHAAIGYWTPTICWRPKWPVRFTIYISINYEIKCLKWVWANRNVYNLGLFSVFFFQYSWWHQQWSHMAPINGGLWFFETTKYL